MSMQETIEQMKQALNYLVGEADRLGLVIRITGAPQMPLAMGNEETVVEVRKSLKMVRMEQQEVEFRKILSTPGLTLEEAEKAFFDLQRYGINTGPPHLAPRESMPREARRTRMGDKS